MIRQLHQSEWIRLDPKVRHKLREVFKIPRTGPTETVGNELISDGTTESDLEKMDIGMLIEFLGNDLPYYDDGMFSELFAKTIEKLYGKSEPVGEPAVGISEPVPVPTPAEGTVAGGNRKPGRAKGNLPKAA